MRRRRRTRVFAWVAVFALALLAAGHARAKCNFDELSSAVKNTPSFVQNNADCAKHFANPAFWGLTTTINSIGDLKSACKDIMHVDASAKDYQQKVKPFDAYLPAELTDVTSSAAEVLSFVSCACAFATESGPAQILDWGGDCLEEGICWIFNAFGDPCDNCPAAKSPPVEHDCANAWDDNAYDPYYETFHKNYMPWNLARWRQKGDFYFLVSLPGECDAGRIMEYCYCPKPMVMGLPGDGDPNFRRCDCPAGTHKAGFKDPVLARTCLCDGTNELVNLDGSCPPPCECKNNQIVLAKASTASQCKCGCPDDQVLVGEHCVTPCEDPREIPVANGSCCLAVQVSSCGTCCPLGSKPDAASGSCVYAPPPPPKETLSPELPKPP